MTPRPAPPVAIIGMACRFPGAGGVDAFWRLLDGGGDAIGEVPGDRFDIDAVWDPRPGTPGRVASRAGGFLPDIDRFDPGFFGIAPREAARMDPQQRLLLEVAWEALEDGGQVPGRLRGSATGVFVGMWTNDFEARLYEAIRDVDLYVTTGSGRYAASGRLSYVFDLRGPSLTVDTACSSSLVAVHLACQALRSGDCALALAGASNLILQPQISIGYSRSTMLAPDGRCKFADARADGYVRSEGVAMLVLKPLAAALADGDPVHAVIRGSAVNNDGCSSELLVSPSPRGQEAMLREAYRHAGVDPREVQYVEAHGTGTRVGDRVELQALGAVLGAGRGSDRPCLVGSVKTNIGHTEATAGLAGIVKVALAFRHGVIPASLHVETLNPGVPWPELPLRLVREPTPWPVGHARRLAGVSSFGVTGTNAHVVLEEPPAPRGGGQGSREGSRVELLPISAHTPEALAALVGRYRALAEADASEAPPLADACHTAAVRRIHHEHRVAVVARSWTEVSARLAAWASGEATPGVVTGRASGPRTLVFVFPGQGSQWVGMGRQLLAEEPAFRDAIERCDRAFRRHVEWSLTEELTAPEARSRLGDIDVLQPTLCAIQVGLAALWRAKGITPDAVVGHSMGEVAAAHVAGALSLEDAARVICVRSRLLRRIRGRGAMAAIGLSVEEARLALRGREDRLAVAVSNSPASTVIAGDPAALDALMAELRDRNVFCSAVKVDVASHSPQVDELREDLLAGLAGLDPRPPSLPMQSTVTGGLVGAGECDAGYWVRNLRDPVLFSAAVQRLLREGDAAFVEISPHPILLPAIEQVHAQAGRDALVVPSLRRDADEVAALHEALGVLYCRGLPGDWGGLHPARRACVRLPQYPWQRKRYWFDERGRGAGRPWRPPDARRHPLLARHLTSAAGGTRFWELDLERATLPWNGEHRVGGARLVPLSLAVEMAVAASLATVPNRRVALDAVAALEPIFMAEDEPVTLQLVLAPAGGAGAPFQIFGRPAAPDGGEDEPAPLASGSIAAGPVDGAAAGLEPIDTVRGRCGDERSPLEYDAWLRAGGLEVTPGLPAFRRIWRRDGEALGEIDGADGVADRADYHAHPGLLDAALALTVAALASEPAGARPFDRVEAIEQVRWHGALGTARWAHVRVRGERPGGRADVHLRDPEGRLLLEALGVKFGRLEPAAVERGRQQPLRDWLYEVTWEAKDRSASEIPATSGLWLVLADASGVGDALARRLADAGARCARLRPGAAFARPEEGVWTVDPASAGDLARALREARATADGPLRGVVHLWALDAPSSAGVESSALLAATLPICASVPALVAALSADAGRPPAPLWLVTREAQPVIEGAVAVAQAPLWGLGRVVALEHPDLWGGLVDLDGAGAAAAAARLIDEMLAPDGEDQVAFRDGRRHVARLARSRTLGSSATSPLRFRSDAAYLITGGLGRLGLAVADWMARHGARHLVLTGRRGLPARAGAAGVAAGGAASRQMRALQALKGLGARVHVVAADASDARAMAALFARFGDDLPPLRGIVHAAGTTAVRALAETSAGTLRADLAAKVAGAWNLHELSAPLALDFFVLFSSAAAVWGGRGLAAYAAANHFMDALAHHRARAALPAVSVNWGRWAEVGVAGEDAQALWERVGLYAMPASRALRVLGHVLAGPPQRTVALVDWARFRAAYEARRPRPFLARLDAVAPEEAPASGARGAALRTRLEGLTPEERVATLAGHIRDEVAAILGFEDGPDAVDPGRGFFQMGMDSLMAVELRNRLASALGRALPTTLAFNYPTVDALARHLAAAAGGPGGAAAVEAPAARSAAAMAALSDAEAEALLAEKLAALKAEGAR